MIPGLLNLEDRPISKYLNLGEGDDFFVSSFSSSLRLINAQGGDDDIFINGDGRAIVYGGSGRDTISGGNGGDTLYGGSGADSLYGGGGGTTNTLYGGSGEDYVVGGDGGDTVYGGSGDDILIGDDVTLDGFGSDTIYGGLGNDTIYGGAGGDEMWGGDGADVFAYLNNVPQYNSAPVADPDRIMDFDQSQDIIDLSAIDAIRSTNGNEAFTLVSNPSTINGRMWIERVDADTQRVFLNYDGGAADMMIEVSSVGGAPLNLGASDFLL